MKIKVDETNLAAAHVMPLFEAAQKIADMTGDVVLIETFYGIKFEPAPKDELDAPVMPNIEQHKWPDLNDSNSSKGSDDPFAVDWRIAPKEATHHAFDGSTGSGYWYRHYPAKNEAARRFVVSGNLGTSGFNLPPEIIERWEESITIRPPVPCTITTSSLLKDQAS